MPSIQVIPLLLALAPWDRFVTGFTHPSICHDGHKIARSWKNTWDLRMLPSSNHRYPEDSEDRQNNGPLGSEEGSWNPELFDERSFQGDLSSAGGPSGVTDWHFEDQAQSADANLDALPSEPEQSSTSETSLSIPVEEPLWTPPPTAEAGDAESWGFQVADVGQSRSDRAPLDSPVRQTLENRHTTEHSTNKEGLSVDPYLSEPSTFLRRDAASIPTSEGAVAGHSLNGISSTDAVANAPPEKNSLSEKTFVANGVEYSRNGRSPSDSSAQGVREPGGEMETPGVGRWSQSLLGVPYMKTTSTSSEGSGAGYAPRNRDPQMVRPVEQSRSPEDGPVEESPNSRPNEAGRLVSSAEDFLDRLPPAVKAARNQENEKEEPSLREKRTSIRDVDGNMGNPYLRAMSTFSEAEAADAARIKGRRNSVTPSVATNASTKTEARTEERVSRPMKTGRRSAVNNPDDLLLNGNARPNPSPKERKSKQASPFSASQPYQAAFSSFSGTGTKAADPFLNIRSPRDANSQVPKKPLVVNKAKVDPFINQFSNQVPKKPLLGNKSKADSFLEGNSNQLQREPLLGKKPTVNPFLQEKSNDAPRKPLLGKKPETNPSLEGNSKDVSQMPQLEKNPKSNPFLEGHSHLGDMSPSTGFFRNLEQTGAIPMEQAKAGEYSFPESNPLPRLSPPASKEKSNLGSPPRVGPVRMDPDKPLLQKKLVSGPVPGSQPYLGAMKSFAGDEVRTPRRKVERTSPMPMEVLIKRSDYPFQKSSLPRKGAGSSPDKVKPTQMFPIGREKSSGTEDEIGHEKRESPASIPMETTTKSATTAPPEDRSMSSPFSREKVSSSGGSITDEKTETSASLPKETPTWKGDASVVETTAQPEVRTIHSPFSKEMVSSSEDATMDEKAETAASVPMGATTEGSAARPEGGTSESLLRGENGSLMEGSTGIESVEIPSSETMEMIPLRSDTSMSGTTAPAMGSTPLTPEAASDSESYLSKVPSSLRQKESLGGQESMMNQSLDLQSSERAVPSPTGSSQIDPPREKKEKQSSSSAKQRVAPPKGSASSSRAAGSNLGPYLSRLSPESGGTIKSTKRPLRGEKPKVNPDFDKQSYLSAMSSSTRSSRSTSRPGAEPKIAERERREFSSFEDTSPTVDMGSSPSTISPSGPAKKISKQPHRPDKPKVDPAFEGQSYLGAMSSSNRGTTDKDASTGWRTEDSKTAPQVSKSKPSDFTIGQASTPKPKGGAPSLDSGSYLGNLSTIGPMKAAPKKPQRGQKAKVNLAFEGQSYLGAMSPTTGTSPTPDRRDGPPTKSPGSLSFSKPPKGTVSALSTPQSISNIGSYLGGLSSGIDIPAKSAKPLRGEKPKVNPNFDRQSYLGAMSIVTGSTARDGNMSPQPQSTSAAKDKSDYSVGKSKVSPKGSPPSPGPSSYPGDVSSGGPARVTPKLQQMVEKSIMNSQLELNIVNPGTGTGGQSVEPPTVDPRRAVPKRSGYSFGKSKVPPRGSAQTPGMSSYLGGLSSGVAPKQPLRGPKVNTSYEGQSYPVGMPSAETGRSAPPREKSLKTDSRQATSKKSYAFGKSKLPPKGSAPSSVMSSYLGNLSSGGPVRAVPKQPSSTSKANKSYPSQSYAVDMPPIGTSSGAPQQSQSPKMDPRRATSKKSYAFGKSKLPAKGSSPSYLGNLSSGGLSTGRVVPKDSPRGPKGITSYEGQGYSVGIPSSGTGSGAPQRARTAKINPRGVAPKRSGFSFGKSKMPQKGSAPSPVMSSDLRNRSPGGPPVKVASKQPPRGPTTNPRYENEAYPGGMPSTGTESGAPQSLQTPTMDASRQPPPRRRDDSVSKSKAPQKGSARSPGIGSYLGSVFSGGRSKGVPKRPAKGPKQNASNRSQSQREEVSPTQRVVVPSPESATKAAPYGGNIAKGSRKFIAKVPNDPRGGRISQGRNIRSRAQTPPPQGGPAVPQVDLNWAKKLPGDENVPEYKDRLFPPSDGDRSDKKQRPMTSPNLEMKRAYEDQQYRSSPVPESKGDRPMKAGVSAKGVPPAQGRSVNKQTRGPSVPQASFSTTEQTQIQGPPKSEGGRSSTRAVEQSSRVPRQAAPSSPGQPAAGTSMAKQEYKRKRAGRKRKRRTGKPNESADPIGTEGVGEKIMGSLSNAVTGFFTKLLS